MYYLGYDAHYKRLETFFMPSIAVVHLVWSMFNNDSFSDPTCEVFYGTHDAM